MDSSTGSFVVIPGRAIPGLAVEPEKPNVPNPARVAILLDAVDTWWESRSVPVETESLIGGEG
ncbi:MAG: hypothetical protein ABSG01_09115 [Anaerolineales bacterium]|jgi:hypothetical protein